jgi:hypothetical protein
VLLRGGAYAEARRELAWREVGEGRRQGVTLAPGLGLALAAEGPKGEVSPQVDLGLPVLLGHQTEGWEWVGGVQALGRLEWHPQAVDPQQRFNGRMELGLTVGAVGRSPLHLGWQLGYRAPVTRLGGGSFSLGVGFALDVVQQK